MPSLEDKMLKARFALAAVAMSTRVWWRLRRQPLPAVVAQLGSGTPMAINPHRLPAWTDRSLRLGPLMPRCLVRSLVLFHFLRSAGVEADLVIGLPPADPTTEAHSWVEVHGNDVGPPPGRGPHEELIRYPRKAWV